MAQNPPEGTPQIYPRLTYVDPTRAVAWLEDAFGLSEVADARVPDDGGNVLLTEMALGAGRVAIGRAGGHGLDSPERLGGGTGMVVVYVDAIREHYARARGAGARLEIELAEQPWGDWRYEALDVEGHRWCFLEHVRDVPPEEWKAAVQR